MSVPAGWYDDGSGRQRWWDGEQWTEHFAPAQGEAAQATAESGADSPRADLGDIDATVRREDVPQRDTDASAEAPANTAAAEEPEAPATPEAPGYTAPEAATSPYAAPEAATNPYTAPGSDQYGAPTTPGPYGDPHATAAYPATPTYPGGAPAHGAPAYGAPAYGAPGAPAAPRKTPLLGFVALGLAVVGTILAFVPVTPVVIVGMVLLFAAFVVSIIAFFVKNTAKWPAIVAIVLSVIGGVIAVVTLVASLFVSYVNDRIDEFPTDFPSSIPSEEPSDDAFGETDADAAGRPAPEEITAGFLEVMHSIEITEYDDPTISACIGQFFYDSELSDESLQTIAGGDDVFGPDGEQVATVTQDAVIECAAQ